MYKDADKRKVSDRERQRRYRANKGVTKSVTPTDVTPSVTPEFVSGMGEWVKLRGVSIKDHCETPVKLAMSPPAVPGDEAWRREKNNFTAKFLKGK